MRKCRNCGAHLIPEKEYILNDRVLCDDCCLEERISYARKTHWQYIRSIKSKYLIPSCQDKQDHKAYRKYINTHPEEFEDEPPLGGCLTPWLQSIQEGKSTWEDVERSANGRRKRWEAYHLAKAEALDFDIDIKKFESTGYSNFSIIE